MHATLRELVSHSYMYIVTVLVYVYAVLLMNIRNIRRVQTDMLVCESVRVIHVRACAYKYKYSTSWSEHEVMLISLSQVIVFYALSPLIRVEPSYQPMLRKNIVQLLSSQSDKKIRLLE